MKPNYYLVVKHKYPYAPSEYVGPFNTYAEAYFFRSNHGPGLGVIESPVDPPKEIMSKDEYLAYVKGRD